jgi:hypothetical protein
MPYIAVPRSPLRTMLNVVLLLCGICAASPDVWADAGAAGLAFLKLGTAGRGVAMGDAITAAVRGASSTYYNPAGLSVASTPGNAFEFLFMHKEWIQDTRTEFLGGRMALGEHHTIGVSILTTTVSDIEIRTRPGDPQGTFSSRDLAIGLSYAYEFDNHLRLGLTTRFLYEQILIDDVQGVGVDAGVQYDGFAEGLTLGATVANLGTMSLFRNETLTLPTLARAGAAYTVNLTDLNSSVVIAGDLQDIFEESVLLMRLGAEWSFHNNFFVRAGYQFGSEGRGLSLGGGLQYGPIGADYAFSRLSNDLGNGHTMTVRVEF